MCDIVDIECEGVGCTRMVETHIGDFCVPPEDVRVWCGPCSKRFMKPDRAGNLHKTRVKTIRLRIFPKGAYIHYEAISHRKPGLGSHVLFVSTNPAARDIHLNMLGTRVIIEGRHNA